MPFSVRRPLIFALCALLLPGLVKFGLLLERAIAVEPLCYVVDSDGNMRDLTGLCGGTSVTHTIESEPATSTGSDSSDTEVPGVREYADISVGTTRLSLLEERLGKGERGRSLNRGGRRSTEFSYQWRSPGGNRLGVLVQNGVVSVKVYRSRFTSVDQISSAGFGSDGVNPIPCIFNWQLRDDNELCFPQ